MFKQEKRNQSSQPKIKLFHITLDDPKIKYSGKSRVVKSLSDSLLNFPVEEVLIGPEGHHLMRFIIKTICFSISKINRSFGKSLRLYLYSQLFVRKKLKKTLESQLISVNSKNHPVIVQAHDFFSILIANERKELAFAKKVVTIHSLGSVADEMVKEGDFKEESYFHRIIKEQEREALRQVDAIVVPSRANMVALLSAFPELPPNKFSIIRNPVDPQFASYRIKREDIGYSKKDYLISTACHMKRLKRLDLLVEIAKRTKETIPEAKFLVIGDGPERTKIENLIANNGLKDKIRITGFREDAVDLLRLSDVIILTSFQENFPTVLTEAAFLAKPIVAFDVGGVSEIVEDNKNGFLVPFGNVEEFTKKISLLCDPYLRESMGNASSKIGKNYLPKRIAQQYFELYECLIRKDSLSH